MTNEKRKALNARFHQLVSICKLDNAEKKLVLRSAAPDKKPESSTELSDSEMVKAIKSLESRLQESLKKMRAKAINLARGHNLVTGEHPNIDWTGFNSFTQKTWKKPFYELSYTELRHCITALQKWENHNYQKALNAIL